MFVVEIDFNTTPDTHELYQWCSVEDTIGLQCPSNNHWNVTEMDNAQELLIMGLGQGKLVAHGFQRQDKGSRICP